MKPSAFLILPCLLMIGHFADAKEFRNAYVSFQYPDSWECKAQDTEWVCRSRVEKSAEEAVVVFTAKESGPEDTVRAYTAYLGTRMNAAARSGGTLSTIIDTPKTIVINNHPWVAAIHKDSEIKNYFTRYLATVKDGVAIAITFTAHKDSYSKYQKEFFDCANSLRVIATKTMLANPGTAVIPGRPPETNGINSGAVIPDSTAPMPVAQSSGSKTKAFLFLMAVLLAAGALYVLLRVRRK